MLCFFSCYVMCIMISQVFTSIVFICYHYAVVFFHVWYSHYAHGYFLQDSLRLLSYMVRLLTVSGNGNKLPKIYICSHECKNKVDHVTMWPVCDQCVISMVTDTFVIMYGVVVGYIHSFLCSCDQCDQWKTFFYSNPPTANRIFTQNSKYTVIHHHYLPYGNKSHGHWSLVTYHTN